MFQPTFYPQRHFATSQPFFYRPTGPIPTHSTQNLNFTRDFERFANPTHHGFTSIPSGGHPFFEQQQQRWRPQAPRTQPQQHRRTPAFHFQDKSTSYFMTDPIKKGDDRIAIQLTKVHIGPNGDQQRVLVEQEFSNEKELNKFVRNLRENFEKTFNPHSSTENSRLDESSSGSSKKSGMVVVEEPDEEPKIYEQQAYNANIESKQATASIPTPPSSPTMQPTSPSVPPNRTRTRQVPSPPASHMSSTSTTRSSRHHRNKMKYRRQKDEQKASHVFHMPSFSRPYQATPHPPPFQPRFFHPNQDFQWRFNPKTRSRSHVPPMPSHFPRPPPTPARFPNLTDPFFRPTRFSAPPPPAKFRRSHRQKFPPQPTTITENHVFPNQQQPRVHRAKSEARHHFIDQQHFSPLQSPPLIQRHFVPFRSPPILLTSGPLFYPQQRKQPANSHQRQFRFINQFHLGTQRF